MRYIVALLDAPEPVRHAVAVLHSAGFDPADITLLSTDAAATPGTAETTVLEAFLRARGVPGDEALLYTEGARRGGTVLVVQAPTALAGVAAEVLNAIGVADIDEHAARWASAPRPPKDPFWAPTPPPP